VKTMQAIRMPRPPRTWVVLPLVVATLAILSPVSAQAAPEPPPPPGVLAAAKGTVRVFRGAPGPRARGYGAPWEYGPGPLMGPAGPVVGRQIDLEGPDAPRWLVALLVGFLVVLVAVLAAALAWILLRRRNRGAAEAGAQQILERRLAEGTIDVEEFERRREALRRDPSIGKASG
jgi:hypothetical protein